MWHLDRIRYTQSCDKILPWLSSNTTFFSYRLHLPNFSTALIWRWAKLGSSWPTTKQTVTYILHITTGLLEFAKCPKDSANHLKHSANGSPSVTLSEQHSPKKVTAKPTLPSVFYRALGKAFAECPTLGKVETKKNPKKWEFLPKKIDFFLSMEAPTGQRPPIYDIFRVNFMATRPTRFEPENLPLCTYLLYHYTTLSLVSGFRFSSQYIILNRV